MVYHKEPIKLLETPDDPVEVTSLLKELDNEAKKRNTGEIINNDNENISYSSVPFELLWDTVAQKTFDEHKANKAINAFSQKKKAEDLINHGKTLKALKYEQLLVKNHQTRDVFDNRQLKETVSKTTQKKTQRERMQVLLSGILDAFISKNDNPEVIEHWIAALKTTAPKLAVGLLGKLLPLACKEDDEKPKEKAPLVIINQMTTDTLQTISTSSIG